MSNTLLVLDPGELGWTLCCLIPRARAIAAKWDGPVAVATSMDRRPAWEFADVFVEVRSLVDTQDFLRGQWCDESAERLAAFQAGVPIARTFPSPQEVREVVTRERSFFRSGTGSFREWDAGKEWKRMGPRIPRDPGLACVAFRPPKRWGDRTLEWKAWPREHCDALVASLHRAGFHVACLGGPDNYSPGGTWDLTGAPMGEQCDALARASVCIGPSSAPLHLAHLCGCPVATWYGAPEPSRATSRARYCGSWNPFQVPTRFLWSACPDPEAVLEAAKELAEGRAGSPLRP
jgi:hypothetical protein